VHAENDGRTRHDPGRDPPCRQRRVAISIACASKDTGCSPNRCSVRTLFHACVFVATTTVCLAGDPDTSCRRVIALLDQVPPGSPVIDVLRAHQSGLR
jgi:hypothetical protein